MTKKIVAVTTVSVIKATYLIETDARSDKQAIEHAADSVTLREADAVSYNEVDESILSARVVTRKEAEAICKRKSQDHPYTDASDSPWMAPDSLIYKIDHK